MILDLCQSGFFYPKCYRIGSSEFGRLCGMYSIVAISQKVDLHLIGSQLVSDKMSIGIRLGLNCLQIGSQFASDWLSISI